MNGILNQLVDAKGTTLIVAWGIIHDYISSRVGERQEAVIEGHNPSFDLRFIKAELKRNNITLPLWERSCSAELARTHRCKECKLTTLAKQAGAADFQLRAHRTGHDIAALAGSRPYATPTLFHLVPCHALDGT